jgi:hypothetical protein
LTAKEVAWCADVAPQRRRAWAEAGRLKAKPPFTEHDVIESAVAFSMTAAGVSQKAATVAWDRMRPQLRRLLIAGERRPWLVVSADGPRAEVVADETAAARAAATMGRCWVVSSDRAVEEALNRLAELEVLAVGAQIGGDVRRLG